MLRELGRKSRQSRRRKCTSPGDTTLGYTPHTAWGGSCSPAGFEHLPCGQHVRAGEHACRPTLGLLKPPRYSVRRGWAVFTTAGQGALMPTLDIGYT